MTLQFPLTMTFDEIAALPEAADHFSWDASMIDPHDTPDEAMTLVNVVRDYSLAYRTADKLSYYLASIGYIVTEAGVTIQNKNSLRLAHSLFMTIIDEYDRTDLLGPGATLIDPTWQLFGLGGDDDVDYCGTQPSCLTALLLMLHEDYEA